MQYRHYKGGMYTLVCEAQLEADPKIIMVVYEDRDGKTWVRPASEFYEMVQHEGMWVPRFAPMA